MRLLRAAVSVLVLGLVAAFLHSPPPSYAATTPDAEVHIHAQAFEGPRGTILASYRARCAPGFEFADSVIDFSQGSVVAPSTHGQPIPCDGAWHEQKTTSLEAFEPGPATMTVRLSVTDIDTGDPGKQGVDTARIFVRPTALTVIPATVTLLRGSVVKLVLKARCDKPWVLQDFHVAATQDEFPNTKADDEISQTYPRCDGVLHTRTFLFKADPGSFHRGWLRVDTSISLLDPVDFDPVTQANQTRLVKVL